MSEKILMWFGINLSRVDEVDNEGNLLFFPHNIAICAYGSVPAVHAKKLGNWW